MKWVKKHLTGMGVIKVLLYLFFLLFLVIPLIAVFMVSFTNEPINFFGSFISSETLNTTLNQFKNATLDNFKSMFSNTRYLSALLNSLYLSLIVSVVVLTLCVPIAYGIARTKMPFKKTISALCTVPLIVPTFISAYAFIIMFGRSGWVTYIYQSLGGEGLFIDPYSLTGIVLVQVFFFFPYALWPMVAAFKISDVSLEEASRNMGAKGWLTFSTVTFPLVIPGMLSTALVIFAVSFSDFGTPIVLAPTDLNLLVVEAYREIAGFFNWGGAAILTLIMIAVAGFAYWAQNFFFRGKNYDSVSGKPKQVKLSDNKPLNISLALFAFFVVSIPLFAMASVFLQSIATTWGKDPLPSGYTLNHYKTIFTSSLGNIQNSLILAFGALVLSIIISVFVSYFVVRQNSVTLDFMTTIPLVVPGIAFGIALIQTFNVAPLQLTGTAAILIIAYSIRRLPYMVRSTVGTMQSIKADIEEAAVNLGASTFTAAVTIIGPLMIPGIAAGSVLVFITVLKETSITILLAPAKWAPMSLAIFQNILRAEYYSAAAMSIILVVLVLLLQGVANFFTRKQS
ncbi:ABC transporter permease [Pseudogracilibacillus auburnensis]|uniref:ABC transporter permease n=1 Tax=Pseudogracilibacillus auburnensis TaxID=1494959 RepID=UPI001A96BCDF|nr:iron ABC transporter permease [Pseudogracilibacillus auburnensis]MBO1004206.1 iron ABC transporter permease [Pseudogracilibacillus auburnensis]